MVNIPWLSASECGYVLPQLLESAALDDHCAKALLAVMYTSQTQLVVFDSAFVVQKESQRLLSVAHSGYTSPPSVRGLFWGGFLDFLRATSQKFR